MGLLFRPYYPIVRLMARATVPAGTPPVPVGPEVRADQESRPPGGESIPRVEGAKRPPSVRSAARHRHPRTDPLMSRLERLARLHQGCAVSDGEFGVAKSKLLRM